MTGTWQRLAHAELSGSADTISSGTFDVKKNLMVMLYVVPSGTTNARLRFNSDTNDNYADRKQSNGGSDGTVNSQTSIRIGTGVSADQYQLNIVYITNIADKEKLVIYESNKSATGAGTSPDRQEGVGKWANTSDSITSIDFINTDSGDFAAGSYITVFGASDDIITDEKTTLTNLPVNTRYEETDTRKIYRWREDKSLTNGLIALYNFDSSWSNNATDSDSVGTGGDMTAQNSATFSTSVKKLGSASASFPNDGDYAKTSTSDGANFVFTGNSSVTVWVRRTDGWDSDYHAMVSKRGSHSEYNLYLTPTSGKAYCYIKASDGTTTNVATTGTIADDTWVHLATTIDDMTLKFYINGSLDSTHTITSGSKESQSVPFGVGAISNTGAEGFMGYLDQVSVWNRVLSADEISKIYNSGNGFTDLNALIGEGWIERNTAT